jgi:hypothetical protein
VTGQNVGRLKAKQGNNNTEQGTHLGMRAGGRQFYKNVCVPCSFCSHFPIT